MTTCVDSLVGSVSAYREVAQEEDDTDDTDDDGRWTGLQGLTAVLFATGLPSSRHLSSSKQKDNDKMNPRPCQAVSPLERLSLSPAQRCRRRHIPWLTARPADRIAVIVPALW
jgi:hypothetical protein